MENTNQDTKTIEFDPEEYKRLLEDRLQLTYIRKNVADIQNVLRGLGNRYTLTNEVDHLARLFALTKVLGVVVGGDEKTLLDGLSLLEMFEFIIESERLKSEH